MDLLTKLLQSVDDGAERIIISFHPSTKRLEESEIRKLNAEKDISFIRGNVQVKSRMGKYFKVYATERNVSFGRFKREIFVNIRMEHGNFTVDVYDFEEVFPSF